MTKQKLGNEIDPSKMFIPGAKSKKFTCEQTQKFKPSITNSNLIDNINNFNFTDLKAEKKFT